MEGKLFSFGANQKVYIRGDRTRRGAKREQSQFRTLPACFLTKTLPVGSCCDAEEAVWGRCSISDWSGWFLFF